MSRVVYFNGKFVEEREARISIYDSALMFGDMVFEMTRSYNREHFLLGDHIERLYQGLKLLHINPGMSPAELLEACMATSEINDANIPRGDEHRLMINVSRGPLSIYSHLFDDPRPTIVIADFPLSWTIKSMGPLLTQGIELWIPPQRAIPEQLMDPKIKNRSRLFYQMANIQVSSMTTSKRAWALLIDTDGFITEGTGSNFFMIKDGELITPEPRNILRGISRQFIIDLAKSIGMKVREENITVFDVANCDEAFMCGTPFSMLPVASINGLKIGQKSFTEFYAFGEESARLVKAWEEAVGLAFTSQLIQFSKSVQNSGPSPYQFRS